MHPAPHEHAGLTLEAPPLTTCKNCGNHFAGRYCNHCGQRSDTHRITWHYVWHEIPHSVWHVDKGILFTLKELFTRPGYTIREFLNGKRVNHYRPLALILLLGAVLIFLVNVLDVHVSERMSELTGSQPEQSQALRSFQKDLNGFMEHNQHLMTLFMIPITAFFMWRMFRKRSLNYPEHLVANTFLGVIGVTLSIVMTLLVKLLGGSAAGFATSMSVVMVVNVGYILWAYTQLFKAELSTGKAAGRALVGWLMGYFAAMFIGIVIGVTYLLLTGFDDIKREAQLKKARTQQVAPLPKK